MTKLNAKKRSKRKLHAAERKAKRKGTLVEFLMASPLRGSGIEVERLRIHFRKVDFW